VRGQERANRGSEISLLLPKIRKSSLANRYQTTGIFTEHVEMQTRMFARCLEYFRAARKSERKMKAKGLGLEKVLGQLIYTIVSNQ
jgi:hypothetical protein